MMGLSISLDSIPGVASVVAKLDSLRNDFLSIPGRLTVVRNKLSRGAALMSQNGVASGASAKAAELLNDSRAYGAQWETSASEFNSLTQERQAGSLLSLNSAATAVSLVTHVTTLLGNVRRLESDTDALLSANLTDAQKRDVLSSRSVAATAYPLALIAGIGLLYYFASGRRRR